MKYKLDVTTPMFYPYQSPIREIDEMKSQTTADIQTVDYAVPYKIWLKISR